MQDDELIRTRWTVLELTQLPSGEWRATQAGAESEGTGETAAAAAAAYCSLAGDLTDDDEQESV